MNEKELKEIAEQIRVIKESPTLTMDVRDALKRIADKLNPPKEYPPYGVPIEVLNGSGEWLTRVSAGDGFHYDGNGELCTLSAWPKWRYKPVDWERVDKDLIARILTSMGAVVWYYGDNGSDCPYKIGDSYYAERIIRIDRRPE